VISPLTVLEKLRAPDTPSMESLGDCGLDLENK